MPKKERERERGGIKEVAGLGNGNKRFNPENTLSLSLSSRISRGRCAWVSATTYNLRLRTQRFNFTRARSTGRARISKTEVQRGGNNLLICAANKITRFIFVLISPRRWWENDRKSDVTFSQYCQKYPCPLTAAHSCPLNSYRIRGRGH